MHADISLVSSRFLKTTQSCQKANSAFICGRKKIKNKKLLSNQLQKHEGSYPDHLHLFSQRIEAVLMIWTNIKDAENKTEHFTYKFIGKKKKSLESQINLIPKHFTFFLLQCSTSNICLTIILKGYPTYVWRLDCVRYFANTWKKFLYYPFVNIYTGVIMRKKELFPIYKGKKNPWKVILQ